MDERTDSSEVELLGRLQHPNLVELRDLAQEPVDGEPITAAVAREGAPLLLELAAEALRALAFLHDFGLLHRGLEPGNLLVVPEPRAGRRLVLVDFSPALRTGSPPGPPTYLAPELLDDPAAAGPRSDLYALGSVLFEAMHGRPPFRPKGDDPAGFAEAIRAGRRARPAPPEGYPAGLGTFIDELLALDPASRPAGAADALNRMNQLCETDFPAETAAGRAARLTATLGAAAHQRLGALYKMIRAVNSEADPAQLLESILDMAIQVVQAERGMILLRDAATGEFSVRLARGLEKETTEDAEAFSRHIVAEAGAGKPVLALDARQDERFRELKSVSLYGIHSLMCVPLRSRGTIVGTVYLDNRRGGRLFTPDDLRFLEAFADHAALALENAKARTELHADNLRLQAEAETAVRFGNLVGRSPGMLEVFELIEKVAASELTVLIQGESGTGKELVARAIHFGGPRRKRVFISENCAALPDSLLQSELFGHVRGAFTGAERDRAGMFEQADGGTLFLDEIGDMSAAMQAQILRMLQEGEVRRVGGDQSITVDVRLIAATHRDLRQEVADGRFREDLLYRLQVLVIPLPPLRERPGDVRLLTEHFLGRIAAERGRGRGEIDGDVLARIEAYGWPGNVRQLENTLQRLTLLAGDGPITAEVLDLDPGLSRMLDPKGRPSASPLSLQQSERDQIAQALAATKGNRARAARMLGISRATIYRKIKEYRF